MPFVVATRRAWRMNAVPLRGRHLMEVILSSISRPASKRRTERGNHTPRFLCSPVHTYRTVLMDSSYKESSFLATEGGYRCRGLNSILPAGVKGNGCAESCTLEGKPCNRFGNISCDRNARLSRKMLIIIVISVECVPNQVPTLPRCATTLVSFYRSECPCSGPL
ncbi:hypothetical protein BR93DRAFT_724316 [Coniochaeta sp. PMI_546]|nr:hypothetical protein BR93DRAFT_724316 [Coniochaeta sp. PMI_546]